MHGHSSVLGTSHYDPKRERVIRRFTSLATSGFSFAISRNELGRLPLHIEFVLRWQAIAAMPSTWTPLGGLSR